MVSNRLTNKAALSILLFLIGLSAVIVFVLRFEILSWDFRNNLWGPTYLLVHGQDPFRVYVLFPGTNALWSPSAVGFFFYLGFIPLKAATNLWLLFNILVVMGVMFFIVLQKKPGIWMLVSILLLIFLSPVTISHLFFGQASILFVLCSLAAAYFINAKQPGLAGAVLALGLIKPQLAVLVLPGMLVGIWRTTKLTGVIKFGAGILVTLLICLVPVWIGYPDWIDGYVNAFRINPEWNQPTTFRVIQSILPSWGILVWVGMCIAGIILAVFAWLRYLPIQAMAFTLALTTLISPYLWSYDFVLLIPFFLFTLLHLHNNLWIWTYGLIWLLTSLIAVLIRLSTDNNDIRYWWIPWIIFTGGVVISRLDQKVIWPRSQTNVEMSG